MKHKNQNGVSQSLNPFLGFGWHTGMKTQKKIFTSENKNHIVSIKKEA